MSCYATWTNCVNTIVPGQVADSADELMRKVAPCPIGCVLLCTPALQIALLGCTSAAHRATGYYMRWWPLQLCSMTAAPFLLVYILAIIFVTWSRKIFEVFWWILSAPLKRLIWIQGPRMGRSWTIADPPVGRVTQQWGPWQQKTVVINIRIEIKAGHRYVFKEQWSKTRLV